MLRNTFLLSALFVSTAWLLGCNLYFEDGEYRDGSGQREPSEEGWVPESCQIDEQCGPGCFCTEGNICEESTFCEDDGDCSDSFVCDYRGTCIPGEEPPPPPEPTCQSEVACSVSAPICPVGQAAAIVNGCYTSECMAKEDCPDGAPFECSDLSGDEAGCTDTEDCSPVYQGINCTSPTGAECTSASADCSCESFDFDACEDS